jgi:NAD(P)-dependent dehydrogenase (short-subunit alcohol dehydrogenase family)
MEEQAVNLENKVAIVTGATGGLGRVVSRRLAEAGARLVLVSSNPAKLEALANDLQLPAERWGIVAQDLTRPGAGQKVLESALQKFGRADILLHLMGGWLGGKPVPLAPAEDITAMLEQHLWSTLFMTQAVVPHLTANGWGRLVIVSSPTAGSPPANSVPYAIGKAAEETLMLTLAEELKGTGVTANILRVRTIDVKHERDQEPAPKNANWTTPEEIAAAILFLCSDAAHVINGARIPLYGSP